MLTPIRKAAIALALTLAPVALATPEFVEHIASTQVFGEPAGTTMREPVLPREDEAVTIWARIGYSFFYTDVAIYYTLDGTAPQGSRGVPGNASTFVLSGPSGPFTFVRNEPSGSGTIDWWAVTLPLNTRQYRDQVRYVIGAWHSAGGPEIFGNNYGCADGLCDNPAAPRLEGSYQNFLAWPGAGAGQPNPAAGYPPVSFWKEEAVFANTYTAGMLDQNGTVYDFHFPTPGCVQGVATRNEGYSEGLDTFPPLLPPNFRGQMHLNQAMAGIRVDGLTHWLSNPSGVSYTNVDQQYLPRSNSILTTQTLPISGGAINVTQYDFAPMLPDDPAKGQIGFPIDDVGNPQRHIYVKRLILTNTAASPRTVNVYWYLDPALNGGDTYDAMFLDPVRGAMVAYDNTYRVVTGTGAFFTPPNEYNPTTFSGYEKNVSVYLAAAMKTVAAPGAAGGNLSTESWRTTSDDNSQGWIGQQVTLPPGVPVEVNILMAGGFDAFAGATGTYAVQLDNVVDWFAGESMGEAQSATSGYWDAWYTSGVTLDTPDDDYDRLYERAVMGTVAHVDGVNGGVIAGFHNGAYPFVWPRDAGYAAVTLARSGHVAEAVGVLDWMRETTYRDVEPWGRKGFWKQKYSTDGYVIWGAPQIDETAVFPWALWFIYLTTGDTSLLTQNYDAVRDAFFAMTRDSIDSRLRFEEAFNLVYSNNIWEDSYDTFNYSNANIVRALRDSADIASALGLGADAAEYLGWAATIKSGLDARLDWNGENTDVSQLGIVYPFEVYAPTDDRAVRVIDRINGVAPDTFGAFEPLVNFIGEHQGTINRYWGDTYWNGGPWFLTTMWYGLYYLSRADETIGKGDIDNHKLRLDLMVDRLGPVGLGAEQIGYATGPGASILYPGQADFRLQTAWPNAWESMSTFVDALLKFVDAQADARTGTLRIHPKLPSEWDTLTARNLPVGTARIDLTVTESLTVPAGSIEHSLALTSGPGATVETTIRLPASRGVCSCTVNGITTPFTRAADNNSATVSASLTPGNPAALVSIQYARTADWNRDGVVNSTDVSDFINDWFIDQAAGTLVADFDENGISNSTDVSELINAFFAGCI